MHTCKQFPCFWFLKKKETGTWWVISGILDLKRKLCVCVSEDVWDGWHEYGWITCSVCFQIYRDSDLFISVHSLCCLETSLPFFKNLPLWVDCFTFSVHWPVIKEMVMETKYDACIYFLFLDLIHCNTLSLPEILQGWKAGLMNSKCAIIVSWATGECEKLPNRIPKSTEHL